MHLVFVYFHPRHIHNLWNTEYVAFCENSQRLNTANCFYLILNTSLIIQLYFLILLILSLSMEAATLNLPKIFLIWLAFYLRIFSRNFLFRRNKVMFETCQNFTMRNQNGFHKVVLTSLLLTNWVEWWQWSSKCCTIYIYIYICIYIWSRIYVHIQ